MPRKRKAPSEEGEDMAVEVGAVAEEVSPGTTPESTEVVKSSGIDRLAKFFESETLKRIQKVHGSSILVRGSEQALKPKLKIPSGVFPLDVALGGGFPGGLVSLLWGNKSCAKTTVALRTIGCAQNLCANCYTGGKDGCACGDYRETIAAFIDVEGTLDLDWAARQGVDPDRLLLSVPEYAEQTLDIGEALLRSGECDLMVIDSLAFMTTMQEIQEETAKQLPGVQARTLARGVKKFVSALNEQGLSQRRRPTILLINQLRQKIGVMFGSPDTQGGGLSPQFAAVIEVKFSSSKYYMDEETGRPLHVDMQYRVEKNKAAVPRMEGVFRLILQDTETKRLGDVYDEKFMMEEAEKVGMIEKQGSSWLCLNEKFSAKSAIERRLIIDPVFKNKVRTAILTILAKVYE